MLDRDTIFMQAVERQAAHEAYVYEQSLLRQLGLAVVGLGAAVALIGMLWGLVTDRAPAAPVQSEAPADAGAGALDAGALTGAWKVFDNGYPSAIRFNADGSFARAQSLSHLDHEVVDFGSWEIQSGVLVLNSDLSVESCGFGTRGWYELQLGDEGRGIRFHRLAEYCESRVGFGYAEGYVPLQKDGLFCQVTADAICAGP